MTEQIEKILYFDPQQAKHICCGRCGSICGTDFYFTAGNLFAIMEKEKNRRNRYVLCHFYRRLLQSSR